MAWTNCVISPGLIMWATVLWLFGCLASLDGPLVTNSLFFQTCLSHLLLGVAWAVASFSRGEEGDVKHTFMGGLGGPLTPTPYYWKWVAPSTTIPHWSLIRSWFMTLKELWSLLPAKLHIQNVNYAAKLVQTRRALSSTIISSNLKTVS